MNIVPPPRVAAPHLGLRLLGLLLVCWAAVPGSTAPAASPPVTLFLYAPDVKLQKTSSLLAAARECFTALDLPLALEVFERAEVLDPQILAQKPAFLLCPGWYLAEHRVELALVPLLRATVNGITSYKKLLLGRGGLELHKLDHAKLALTPLGEDTQAMLQRELLKGAPITPATFSLILVNKDIDAIFALAFGQVELSLVRPENLEHLRTVNPRVVNEFKVLHETSALVTPTMCGLEGNYSPALGEHLTKTLLLLGTSKLQAARTFLGLLGYDGFVREAKGSKE
ncbi:MAG: hypothetical protein A2284_09685 [Deltaproteobacteria bacterium RIFOXYA12_FULL_61_11]|nr:MAG: hypothetical protein A2284_09685 [Deltaproteobacteria bacterium RIFOXYA12_FULL_61_11]